MNSALYGFWSIARKELLHIRRDPTTLIFALMIPLLQMTMFGFAIDYDVRHVRTVVVDMDRTRESRDYIAGLHNTQYLDVTDMLATPAQAEDAIRRGAARVAVIIPPDFGRLRGTPNRPQVGVLLDGSDSQVSAPARNAFQRPPAIGASAVDVRINTLYNPQAAPRSTRFRGWSA